MLSAIPVPTLIVMIGFHSLVAVILVIASVLYFRPKLWLPSLALFWGMVTGLVDLLSNEPQLPALLLLSGGFFVAFARPRHAWRWALLIGLWAPAGGLILTVFSMSPEPQLNPFALLLPLAIAFVGAYGGALVARAASMSPGALSRTFQSEEP